MSNINWKQKLSSRKFWSAVIGFITAILFAFNVAEADVEKVVGIITAGATLIAYIFAEGWVDANRNSFEEEAKKEAYNQDIEKAEYDKVDFASELQRKIE